MDVCYHCRVGVQQTCTPQGVILQVGEEGSGGRKEGEEGRGGACSDLQ